MRVFAQAKDELKVIRAKKGYTQREMANLITVETDIVFERTLYVKIENKERGVSPSEAAAIARILECDLNDLFQKNDDKGGSVDASVE